MIAAGRFDEAERLCRGALDDGEPKIPVYLNLAHIAYQKRSIGDAITLLDTVLELDPETGGINSLVHRPSGRELVESDAGGLAQYVYVPGRDPAAAMRSAAAKGTSVSARPCSSIVGG